jgi:hypothetical protein
LNGSGLAELDLIEGPHVSCIVWLTMPSLPPSRDHLAEMLRINCAGHQQRDIANFALDAPVPPSLDLGTDLLFRFDTVLGLTRVPHSASVMSSTRRTETPNWIHLNQRFLDRALPSAIAFNNCRLKGLPPQFRYLQAAPVYGPRKPRQRDAKADRLCAAGRA